MLAWLSGVIELFAFAVVATEKCTEGPEFQVEDEDILWSCTGDVVPSANGQLISRSIARAV